MEKTVVLSIGITEGQVNRLARELADTAYKAGIAETDPHMDDEDRDRLYHQEEKKARQMRCVLDMVSYDLTYHVIVAAAELLDKAFETDPERYEGFEGRRYIEEML